MQRPPGGPSPAAVPLQTLRALLFGKQKHPRTDQSFQEAQEHFQEVVTSALTILQTRAAEGQLMLCYWGRAANVEPPDNSDLCCSTVFLPLPTITIGTTSWCYHGNHTVPSAQ